ncbi:MAG: thermonuclease family protein [Pseudomonadota bacterium]|nr:thermonuclease family protein [Pseudomonadota bacterium]
MTSRLSSPAAWVLFGILLTTSLLTQARSLYGTVSKVTSGDLITLKHASGSYQVRLYGVDAPDSGAFSAEAKRMMVTLLQGRRIRVRVMTRNHNGEMVAQLFVYGQDVGVKLLKAGFALRVPNVHYKPTIKGQADGLVLAETEARRANRGLWLQPPTVTATDDDAAAAATLPDASRAAGTPDTNASKKSGDDNECAVVIDPTNTQRLFQSCNTSSAGLFAAFSSDGGLTWGYPDPADKTIADGDPGQGQNSCCDPTLAWDRFGNLYVTYINGSLDAIVTLLSTNGGSTFSEIGSFAGSVDQPTIVAASVAANAAVWVVWNQDGDIVSRGAQATGLGTVSAFSAVQSIGSSDCNFGDIAIAPSGAVVQVCESPSGGEGPADLRMNVDVDGLGAGLWSATTTVTATNVGGFDFIPAQNNRSVDSEAGLAYDANPASARFGRLYMVYTEETTDESDDLDILVRFSDNNGTAWSTPIQVNDDTTTRSQFLPKIAIDPTSGNVGICWHDARNSATNSSMQLYCATAAPAATPVFTVNVQIGDAASTSNGDGVEFGDYMGLAFVGGKLHPVWGDTSNSTGDNPDGTLGFDAYSDNVSLTSSTIFKNSFEN